MADKKEKFKKAFWENPAMAFISTNAVEEPKTTEEPPQDHHRATTEPQAKESYVVKHKIVNSEVKTRRVQLVFRPSTHKAATEKAEAMGLSLNEYIHNLIEQDIAHNE